MLCALLTPGGRHRHTRWTPSSTRDLLGRWETGQAVGANPVAIVVPCHRVVGSDNALHGFSGGLARKAALLRLEGIYVDGDTARSRVHPGELRLPL